VENISPAEFISADVDGFKPELDAYLVWMVEWVHELHVGKSVWSAGIMPHVIEIGKVYVRP